MQQITIKNKITIKGIGLHTGKKVTMKLCPAPIGTGIIFKRVDLKGNNIIKAHYEAVKDTTLCTLLMNDFGVQVGTVEHFMASVAAFRIDNLLIEIDAPELPILDGSAKKFIQVINKTGIEYQNAVKKVLRIIKPIEVKTEKWAVKMLPANESIFDVTIDFENKVIGKAHKRFVLGKESFKSDISKARTFCLHKDIEYLQSHNLALGGSLNNAVVVDHDKVLNAEGLRYKDEFVRHKLLDAIGDLYLSGYTILGEFIGYKCGHASNNILLREIFKNKDCYVIESQDTVDYPLNVNHKEHNLALS